MQRSYRPRSTLRRSVMPTTSEQGAAHCALSFQRRMDKGYEMVQLLTFDARFLFHEFLVAVRNTRRHWLGTARLRTVEQALLIQDCWKPGGTCHSMFRPAHGPEALALQDGIAQKMAISDLTTSLLDSGASNAREMIHERARRKSGHWLRID